MPEREPTPVRCPAISHPETGLADPADFDALLARLDDAAPVCSTEDFPRGTLQPDGRVDLCKQGVGPLQVGRVVQTAVRSAHPVHLLLGTNGLGAEGARAVADALTPGHRVQTVYLGCNRIDAAGVQALADRIADDQGVRALWLKRNPIGDDGVARLCSALIGNTALRTLDLVNTGLSVHGLRLLAATLAARETKLERLFLGGNGLGPAAVSALSEIITTGGVRELYLAANHLGDTGAIALGEAAAAHPMTLGLGGNGITPAGAAGLAGLMSRWVALDLARPPSERALGATSNVVGDDGAAALAEALPGSDLRRLDLRYTAITGRGVKLLLTASEASRLDYLGLSGGVPRRLKRLATSTLGPAAPAHPDIRAIASVYR
ncbi:Ran GTPase-activating protein (RanGAP) involved in mRNA processing and transport [Allocatelliglobosispora scoriae]|uniref:Ran GTPase-activating protein (RanGAP) involved in mRNA processing and transport n=1 Tax=Allocatelliglobosispora scoriae TaxID=643052 RepID=A0A841BKJ0_9ACTN|nr:gala protein [Allocatelliglobosispora scoriae]MBB5868794.1 Ran GTPase-activating protein (RanGAP) involved in mRNA processing and transport [Allocatelliglobosispora scoriae]